MNDSAITELVAARSVPLIAATHFEGPVQIWDIAAQRKQNEFPIQYQFGSRNLAIHPEGKSIVTGISARRGSVVAYALPDGTMM